MEWVGAEWALTDQGKHARTTADPTGVTRSYFLCPAQSQNGPVLKVQRANPIPDHHP